MESHHLEIYVDGACIPKNPGGTAVWGWLFLRDGIPIDTRGGAAAAEASEKATNHVAEYAAFINALKEVKRRSWDKDKITVYTDSQLLYGQIELGWKVSSTLSRPNARAMELKSSFPSVRLEKIPRERNRVAHRAARAAYYEAKIPRKDR